MLHASCAELQCGMRYGGRSHVLQVLWNHQTVMWGPAIACGAFHTVQTHGKSNGCQSLIYAQPWKRDEGCC